MLDIQDQDPCHRTCTSRLWHSPASSLVDGELFPLCFAQGGGGRGASSLVDGELFPLCFAQGGEGRGVSSLVDGELFALCFAQGGGGRLVDGELFALCLAQGGGRLVDGELFALCVAQGGGGRGASQPRQHEEEEQTLYICPSCQQRLPDLDTLTIHVNDCLEQNSSEATRT